MAEKKNNKKNDFPVKIRHGTTVCIDPESLNSKIPYSGKGDYPLKTAFYLHAVHLHLHLQLCLWPGAGEPLRQHVGHGGDLPAALGAPRQAPRPRSAGGNPPASGSTLTLNLALAPALTLTLTLTLAQVLETGVEFVSHRWLPAVRCPVLVLHAEDDSVVPHPRGLALEAAARLAGKVDITLHSYPAALGLGHCHIHRAPGLPALIQGFVGGLEAQEGRASRLG